MRSINADEHAVTTAKFDSQENDMNESKIRQEDEDDVNAGGKLVDDEDLGLGGDAHPPHTVDKHIVFVDQLVQNEVSGAGEGEGIEQVALVIVTVVCARVPAGI